MSYRGRFRTARLWGFPWLPALLVLAPLLGAAAPPELTGPIDETRLVALTGQVPPAARPAADRGLVPDATLLPHLMLQLRRPAEREQALETLLDALHDPASPQFHRWLDSADFGARFGLADADLAAIAAWLEHHGFTVHRVYGSRMVLDVSGTAGSLREAFHTALHRLEVGGTAHVAILSDPQVPAALAPAIAGFVFLHDFRPHPAVHTRPAYTYSCTNGPCLALAPADLATIYNIGPVFAAGITGQGQTIALLEDSDIGNPPDWKTFRKVLGLAGYTGGTFRTIHPAPAGGPTNCADPGSDTGIRNAETEAAVDAEWATAAAPGAAIELATCAISGSTDGTFIALQNLLDGATRPQIISTSYDSCEPVLGTAGNAAFKAAYQQAVALGISVFVDAGDWGAAGCDGASDLFAVNGIAINGEGSTAYNVAVGGTDYADAYLGVTNTYWSKTNGPTYGSARSYVPEIPWNETCASTLVAKYLSGSTLTYGAGGFCNSTTGEGYLDVLAGSGGRSACALAKAGGGCAPYPKPSWQAGTFGMPADGRRDVPDVSLFAAVAFWGPGYLLCDTSKGLCSGAPSHWDIAGGTSVGTPIMAGVQALVNQKWRGRQGNPNPVYYRLGQLEYGTSGNGACNSTKGRNVASGCVFHDVTFGDTDVPCKGSNNCYLPSGLVGVISSSDSAYAPAFTAHAGWDFATGLGTPNIANLVDLWRATSLPSAAPVSPPPP